MAPTITSVVVLSARVCIKKLLSSCFTRLSRRCYSDAQRKPLQEIYAEAKDLCQSKKLPPFVNPNAVYACNELDLGEVEVYGFDYDYTLACYNESVDFLIYNLGKEMLVNKFKYPKAIAETTYQPGFAVRGLHYDIRRGLLLKVDSFMQIQMGSVYRGLKQLTDEEVLQIYTHKYIPMEYFEDGHGVTAQFRMAHLADLFSLPEMGLLCNAADYFHSNNIDYHPEILFRDVKASVQNIHPVMHGIVQRELSAYLEPMPDLRSYLNALNEGKKKVFLVTNSPFTFVNNGMTFLAGKDWQDAFEVVVVEARKPKFFTDSTTPFRLYDRDQQMRLWDRVVSLEKGQIYCEGTVNQLQAMMGWRGENVLYFGDHPYSDLADVTLHHGWRTGAIIKELHAEIEKLNDSNFKWCVNWMQFLTQILEENQERGNESEEDRKVLSEWKKELSQLRHDMKVAFNPQFGSVFRTSNNPTYFSRRLFRFADIYTSCLTNMFNHSLNHVFYPRRGALPHEYRSWFG